jgi:hypothetical protein
MVLVLQMRRQARREWPRQPQVWVFLSLCICVLGIKED